MRRPTSGTRLITHDSLTTIQNIIANEATYRLGLATMVVGTATYLKKTAVTLSVDDDVLKWFEAQGAEFQHRINAALRHLRRSSPGLADAIEKQTHAWRSADPESARQPRD